MNWKSCIWVGLIASVLVASLFGYIALVHNPQNEFYDPKAGLVWGAFVSLVGLTFTVTMAAVMVLLRLLTVDD